MLVGPMLFATWAVIRTIVDATQAVTEAGIIATQAAPT